MISTCRKNLTQTYLRFGTLFCLLANGLLLHSATFQPLYSFPTGSTYPRAGLIKGRDGDFYGTATVGGKRGGYGTVFKVTTNGVITTLVSFGKADGSYPYNALVQGSDGSFYGTTKQGGNGTYDGYGTVFKVTTNGTLTTVYSLSPANGAEGKYPESGLIQGTDGNFYGTTPEGGPYFDGYHNNYGTVFRVTPSGVFTTMVAFTNSNGANPYGGLMQAEDGNFYGTTASGGSYGFGTIFKMTTNGDLTTLVSFTKTNGALPYAALLQGRDGDLYGTTVSGGDSDKGTVFKVTTNGALTVLVSFIYTNGAYPFRELIQASDGTLYGTTYGGGTNGNYGTVFAISTNSVFSCLYSFTGYGDGKYAECALLEGEGGILYGTTHFGGSSDSGTVFAFKTDGTLTSLASLVINPNGANPYGDLIQGTDGNYYGTTKNGGMSGCGTVFRVTTNGLFTSLASFANTNGAYPYAGLVQGRDGFFYGTTTAGGLGNGVLYRISSDGALTTLYSFKGGTSDGIGPYGKLIQGVDGNFYGTTLKGGANNIGTVFGVATNGTQITLASFANTNGGYPYCELILGVDGSFYGTTFDGGTNGRGGTLFKMTTNGDLSLFASIPSVELPPGYNSSPYGANPYGGLVQARDGNFYGTTVYGGGPPGWATYGAVFKADSAGTLGKVYWFGSPGDGSAPYGRLIQWSDGNLYGTTVNGGVNNLGTLFSMSTNGTLTTLYPFAGGNDGANPYAGLVQGSDGNLYGTAAGGGVNGSYGTIFRLILAPNLLIQPTNQVVAAGGSATFTVGAVGFGSVLYQWRRNGVNIVGATNTTFSLTNVTVTNAANYSVAVSNPGGTILTSNALLVVSCPAITVSPTNIPAITVGQPFNQTITSSGGIQPYAFTRTSGSLPFGITLSNGGVLSGTPVVSGTFAFVVRATDSYGCFGTNRYILTVNCAPISISPAAIPQPRFGISYSQLYTASGDTAPYTFAITSGSLPPGFALSTNGLLSGMPTNFGNYRFTVRARDVYGCSQFLTNSLAIGISLVDPSMDTNGWFWTQVVGPAGGNFEILASSNLSEPINWTPLFTNNAPEGFFDFSDTNSSNSTNYWPQKFYRARLLP